MQPGRSGAHQLRGDHRVAGGVGLPDLHLAAHLAPDAGEAPGDLAAVVAEGPLCEEEEGGRTSVGGRAGGRVCEGSARGGLTGMLWRSRMLPRRMQETTQQKSSKGMQQHQP